MQASPSDCTPLSGRDDGPQRHRRPQRNVSPHAGTLCRRFSRARRGARATPNQTASTHLSPIARGLAAPKYAQRILAPRRVPPREKTTEGARAPSSPAPSPGQHRSLSAPYVEPSRPGRLPRVRSTHRRVPPFGPSTPHRSGRITPRRMPHLPPPSPRHASLQRATLGPFLALIRRRGLPRRTRLPTVPYPPFTSPSDFSIHFPIATPRRAPPRASRSPSPAHPLAPRPAAPRRPQRTSNSRTLTRLLPGPGAEPGGEGLLARARRTPRASVGRVRAGPAYKASPLLSSSVLRPFAFAPSPSSLRSTARQDSEEDEGGVGGLRNPGRLTAWAARSRTVRAYRASHVARVRSAAPLGQTSGSRARIRICIQRRALAALVQPSGAAPGPPARALTPMTFSLATRDERSRRQPGGPRRARESRGFSSGGGRRGAITRPTTQTRTPRCTCGGNRQATLPGARPPPTVPAPAHQHQSQSRHRYQQNQPQLQRQAASAAVEQARARAPTPREPASPAGGRIASRVRRLVARRNVRAKART